MAFRFLALACLLFCCAAPTRAQQSDVSPADREAIQQIIQDQVDAFRRDDGDAAFGYASPEIQRWAARKTMAKGRPKMKRT